MNLQLQKCQLKNVATKYEVNALLVDSRKRKIYNSYITFTMITILTVKKDDYGYSSKLHSKR